MLAWIRSEQNVISGSLRGLRIQDQEFMWHDSSFHDQECPVNGQLSKFSVKCDKRNISRKFHQGELFGDYWDPCLICLYEEVEIVHLQWIVWFPCVAWAAAVAEINQTLRTLFWEGHTCDSTRESSCRSLWDQPMPLREKNHLQVLRDSD